LDYHAHHHLPASYSGPYSAYGNTHFINYIITNMRLFQILAVVVLAVIAASNLAHAQTLGSCGAALEPVFAAAQGYRCVQLTITSTNYNTSAVSYSQGNLYFNRYFDGLVNQNVPSFPVVSNKGVACNQGTLAPLRPSSGTRS
jgi:hypothetical protein